MNNKATAEEIFKIFALKDGSAHIASQNALNGVFMLMDRYRPKNILEIGIGIGTIPYSLNEYAKLNPSSPVRYTGIEENQYCIGEFKKNLAILDKNFTFSHHTSTDTIEPQQFDFLVVDGENAKLEKVKPFINPTQRVILFIEGDRKNQVKTLKELFGNYIFYREISTKKNPDYSPFPKDQYIHGYNVIILNPTLSDKLFVFFRRAVTSIRYRIRQMKNK